MPRDVADAEDTTWKEAARPIGTALLVTLLLAVDDLNPVKVFCGYSRYYEPNLGFHLTEGRIALLAVGCLLGLLISERERLLYYLVRTFFRCTINNMFFRTVEIVGMENLPREGPIILTGNHNNQFVDGVILLTNCSRQISFMIAQKSWDRPMVGFLARAFHCIPVARPQDAAFRGAGRLVADGGPRLRGVGTRFLKQVQAGALVELRGRTWKVREVASDELLVVDGEVQASETDEGDAYKVLPKIDQSGMYDRVYSGLRQGKCLGIFPEGGSHDRTDLLPLKAGVAIIALDAYRLHHMTVPIVPVGLNYFQGHRFGGRVVVEFGPPIVVPEQIYVQHETDRRGATEALLQLVATGMRSVIVPTPDYHALQLIYMARRLYVPDGLKLSAEQTMDLNRRFAVGIQRIMSSCTSRPASPSNTSPGLSAEDIAWIEEFKTETEAYMASLKRLGLRDHQVRQIGWWGVSDLVGRVLYLAVTMCLGAIPQLMFNLPVMYVASRLAATEQQKSLKASTVKLAARDVVMSYKVIYVLTLVPCLYVVYGTLILIFCSWCWTTVAVVLALCPFSAFLGTKASEQGVRAYADIMPILKRLLPGPRAEQDALPGRRAALQKRLKQAVKRFGPLLGDLYQLKSVDWAKEMGWFTYAAAKDSAEEGESGCSPCRQWSEPIKVPVTPIGMTAGLIRTTSADAAASPMPTPPPGLSLGRQVSEPAKVAPCGEAMLRQLSDPVKVSIGLGRRRGGELADLDVSVASRQTTAGSLSVSPRTMSSGYSTSGHASPVLGPSQDCQNTPVTQSLLGLPPTGKRGYYFAFLSNLPAVYTESLLLQELRDGAFVQGRDFGELHMTRAGAVSCVISFVGVGVLRAFLAAFDGRQMRHASESFSVTIFSSARPAT